MAEELCAAHATRGIFCSDRPVALPLPALIDTCSFLSPCACLLCWLLPPVVRFQKRHLLWGYLIFGLMAPGLLGLLTDGSFLLGALWVGGVGRFLSWHCIWTINSLSHWEGIREFSRASSAVYVAIVNFVQNGEVGHGQRGSSGVRGQQKAAGEMPDRRRRNDVATLGGTESPKHLALMLAAELESARWRLS